MWRPAAGRGAWAGEAREGATVGSSRLSVAEERRGHLRAHGRAPPHPRRSRGACRASRRGARLPLSLAATVAGAHGAALRAPGRCPPVHRRSRRRRTRRGRRHARSAGRALTANTCSCMIRTRVRTDHPDRSGRAGALGAVRPGDGRDWPRALLPRRGGRHALVDRGLALRRRPARRSLGAAAAESAHR